MTLLLIGPACEDLIIIGDNESSKVGGASFFQSFVYEEHYDDYLAIMNASNPDLIDEFPDKSKVKLILKDDTHHFINEYPDKDNLDMRKQSTNFADIPILADEIKNILDEFFGMYIFSHLSQNFSEKLEYEKGTEIMIQTMTEIRELIIEDVKFGILKRPAEQIDWTSPESQGYIQKEFDRIIFILSGDED